MSFFHFLKFVMNFLKGHGCLNMSQLSKYGSTWPNKWLSQMLSSCQCMHSSTPVLAKRQILKFYQPHMGKQKLFKGIIEPHLGIIELLLGITKPAEEINKPYLGDFVISSAASKAKTSIIARTPAIIRTNLFKNY